MTRRLITAAPAFAIAMSFAGSVEAGSKHRKRVRTPAPAGDIWYRPSWQEPARMIDGPGLRISSYGCATDEGYGRHEPCDVGDGKR